MSGWILMSIVAACVILLLGVFALKRRRAQPADASATDGLPAAGAALVVLGIIFGESDRVLGYAFIAGGVAISAVPAISRWRRKM